MASADFAADTPMPGSRDRFVLSMRLLFLIAIAASLAVGQSATPPDLLLAQYFSASHERPTAGSEEAVDIEIDASLPRLQKQGKMRAVKVVTRAGQTLYTQLRFTGDKLIRKDVISRYLAADIERRPSYGDFTLAADSYRIERAGEVDYNGRVAQIYRVSPKRKKAGMFRGELWLDTATALPLRVWGDLVKSPSAFLKRPRFVRDYSLVENQSRPRRLILTAHAALVGDVQMTIWFGDGSNVDSAEQSLANVDLAAVSGP
jgi:hypothetical protein